MTWNDLWICLPFRFWEFLFGLPDHPICAYSVQIENGVIVSRKFYTVEAQLAHWEGMFRLELKRTWNFLMSPLPQPMRGAITFDTDKVNQNNTTLVTGSNSGRIHDYATINSTAGTPVTAITYNLVGATALDSSTFNSSAGEFKTWYLLAPATGSNSVAFTGGSAFNASIYSYYNVNQAVPEAHKITTGSGTTITGSITTIAANALVYAVCGFTGAAGNTVTYSTNQGSNRDPANGTDIGGVASNSNADGGLVATPGSYTQTVTIGGTHAGDWCWAQISMAPPSTTVPGILMLLGVGT